LKTLAKEKYESAVSAAWNCASFTTSLKLLYAETPETDRVLKDIAMKAAASYGNELVKSPEFVDLCQKNGEIGVDVLKACFLSSVPGAAPHELSSMPKTCLSCGNTGLGRFWHRDDGAYFCGQCINQMI